MIQKNEFNELFKKVAIKNTSRRKNHVAADAVRLIKSNKNGKLTRFVISKELTRDLPWLEDDKLDLYQASKNLFAIVPASDGSLTLKSNKIEKYKAFQIYNLDLCTTLNKITEATEFSGWVDDDKLFFKVAK